MSSNTNQATPSAAEQASAAEDQPSHEETAPSSRPRQKAAKTAEENAAEAMREIAHEGKSALLRAGHAMKKPATGAAIAGTATIAAAVLWGAAEAAVGVGAALVVYRILRRRKIAQLEYKHAA